VVAKAWVIGAAGMLVALAPARQVHHLGAVSSGGVTGGYFTGRESISVWLWLGVLLLSVMIDVRLSVLFSYHPMTILGAAAAFEARELRKTQP